MQKELEDLQPKLVVAADETTRTMKVIEKESAAAEKTSTKVAADEAAANVKAAESKALKDECEMELAEAMPALEAALAALDTLKVVFSFSLLLFFSFLFSLFFLSLYQPITG